MQGLLIIFKIILTFGFIGYFWAATKTIPMRKLIYLFVLFAFSTLVEAREIITISGKITNTTDGKVVLRGESFSKEIMLKPDGSFSETFPIEYNGSYLLATEQNRSTIYLGKGTKLNIAADDKDFYKTIKYTGAGSSENQYLIEKSLILNGVPNEELFRLNESDFLKKIGEIKTAVLAKYNATTFTNADFKTAEARSINYLEQVYLVNYPSYHQHYAKLENFKTSDSYPKFDPKTDLDNENDYLFSNAYKQLVNAKFNENIEKQLTPNDQFMYKIAFPEMKKYKSQSIKNGLAQALAYEINASNPDATLLYNDLMALSTNEKFKTEITEKYNKIKSLSNGTPSPKFDYENHKGGKTSLESLKGKYVYIDVWATWCGPCRQEIPSLQKVEQQYEGKNIEFVSISIDAKKDYDKWKKLVTDQKLGGTQLIADNDWNSKFVKDYAIDGIPRFILVGPDGNIVNADAPRPSDPQLVNLLTTLKI